MPVELERRDTTATVHVEPEFSTLQICLIVVLILLLGLAGARRPPENEVDRMTAAMAGP